MVKRFFVLLEKFFGVEMEGWFLWGGGLGVVERGCWEGWERGCGGSEY